MYQNRKLKQLTEKEEKIWIYLDSKETCAEFYRQAYSEGFGFGSLEFSDWVIGGGLIAVHSDGQMGHGSFASYLGVHLQKTKVIDYRRYADGEEDYYRLYAELRSD